MAMRLAVVVIHGMGSAEPNYAEPMKEELNERVDDLGRNSNDIAWVAIHWEPILGTRQANYLRAAKRGGDLDYMELRKFVVGAIGDAAGYRRVNTSSTGTYDRIHGEVARGLKQLFDGDLQQTEVPLIVLAHSLGGHIMSNFTWDLQHGAGAGLSDFERMKTHAGMITFGCNIPLFTFAHDPIVPVDFPGSNLTNEVRAKAKWINYYDPDDVLAYPLKAIPAYDPIVEEDVAINVGGLFTSWNPMSHTAYWTDNDFTKPVAKFLATFL